MTITVDSPIIGKGGPLIVDVDMPNAKRTDEIPSYVRELVRLCDLVGFDWRILFAQAFHETAGFSSYWWEHRLNPAGIGITGDPRQNAASHTWKNGTDSARAHIVHMCMYVLGTVHMEVAEWLPLDPRWEDVIDADFEGTVTKLGDLGNGKWATDPHYAEKIAAVANRIFKEEPSMAIVAQECPIETYVVWSGVNRPGLPMPSPSKIVTHEVGNKTPGADEDMHRRFVLSGGGANRVSFHFVVGPTKIVQLLYLDENAWHASDGFWGDGNRDAWGIEHIQIGDFQKTLAHGAWLQAELARNPLRFAIKNSSAFVQDITPENLAARMVRHYDEAPDKKWCPQMILDSGQWEPYKAAAVKAANTGTAPPSEPTYPDPFPWPYKRGDVGVETVGGAKARLVTCEVTCTKPNGTIPRQSASSKSPQTGPKIAFKERRVAIAHISVTNDRGNKENWLAIQDKDDPTKVHRVGAGGFIPKLPAA